MHTAAAGAHPACRRLIRRRSPPAHSCGCALRAEEGGFAPRFEHARDKARSSARVNGGPGQMQQQLLHTATAFGIQSLHSHFLLPSDRFSLTRSSVGALSGFHAARDGSSGFGRQHVNCRGGRGWPVS